MKINFRSITRLMVTMTIAGVFSATAMAQVQSLSNDRQKVSYALGMDIGQAFKDASADIDLNAVSRAVSNAFAGQRPLLAEDKAMAVNTALQQKMAILAGETPEGVAPGTQPAPISKEDAGLMLGDRVIGPSLLPVKDEIDLPIVMQAMTTVFNNGTTLLQPTQVESTLKTFMTQQQANVATRNREQGNAFLAKNKTEAGVVTTASGLQYKVLTQGSGTRPLPTSKVRVHYEGKLLDGTVFDSSIERGQPTEFGLNQVIPGWTEGVALMQPGAKYRFWIPSNLAYGSNGTPGGPIGPDATLVFEVELLAVLP